MCVCVCARARVCVSVYVCERKNKSIKRVGKGGYGGVGVHRLGGYSH